jgi:predicted transporter
MLFGPLLVMGGHMAIHAANATNRELLKIIGSYLLAISAVGCLAQPASPFWAGLVSALILIGAGYGWTNHQIGSRRSNSR